LTRLKKEKETVQPPKTKCKAKKLTKERRIVARKYQMHRYIMQKAKQGKGGLSEVERRSVV